MCRHRVAATSDTIINGIRVSFVFFSSCIINWNEICLFLFGKNLCDCRDKQRNVLEVCDFFRLIFVSLIIKRHDLDAEAETRKKTPK